ncbi:MAG TPA: hypothetical protein PKK23_18225 [Nitrospirales bacterium]|nr:hypothetical protein [Nitrospirales bacterium]
MLQFDLRQPEQHPAHDIAYRALEVDLLSHRYDAQVLAAPVG